ncbi:unnamed protein product [marine sediment metagenome]|uniref:Uncharacterized protein n=1 Tax=marine sediment metagenome TaxID=412755 RepID=X1A262_9ZZZZ
MFQYAILANPGHNRVYFDTSLVIACNELLAISQSFESPIEKFINKNVNLPAAICFTTKSPLKKVEIKMLGSSSIFYALFEIVEEGLLKPLMPEDFRKYPDSINRILRYNGKTNEQFTI